MFACVVYSEAQGAGPKPPAPIHFIENPDGSITIAAADVPRLMKGLKTVFTDNALFEEIIRQQTKKIESMKCV
jgi:hypothetical protein